jgi:hypothetical protein
MTDPSGAILDWLVPVVVVFGITAIGVAIAVWALRRARISPRARAAATAERERAGAALVRLDDAVDELDVEVGLSGALYGGGAPASLRRARLTAQRVRDESFEEYRAISGGDPAPDDIRKVSARIGRRCADALGVISAARAEHGAWVQANVTAAQQVTSARERLDQLRSSMGNPTALVSELAARFAEDEWGAAARAARAAVESADDAERLLDAAAERAADPSRSVLAELSVAERALRKAETETRLLEESHRIVTQAALAVPGEIDAARGAIRQALKTREHLEPADADRLGTDVRAIEAELTAWEADAARRPTRAVDAIARLRDRLDLALGDARTAQQRLRGARTALPGTLAAARAALVEAEASLALSPSGVEARSRLLSAQQQLAAARQAPDPITALDAARRAMRDAEDAKALADFDRLGSG